MSINIYKNGSAYSPTPIINNGTNIYEPLIYTKDKMYSPANLTGNDLIFSYKNSRTIYTNSYWSNGGGIYNTAHFSEDWYSCFSSFCCCNPWQYGNGLYFAKYQYSFGSNVGVFSGNISKMNVNYYDVYLNGNAQNGQIFWPVNRLSNYPNRILHTNAIVTVPKYFFQPNKITKTLYYTTASPKRYGTYDYAAIAVTADFIPPAFRLGIGYKGGNAVSANSDTSKAGRIDLYYESDTAYTGKKAHCETCRSFSPNVGLSSLTSTVGSISYSNGTYGGCSNKYLGKNIKNDSQYIFKVNNYIYLSAWGINNSDWYRESINFTNSTAYVSAISPPVIGLKTGSLTSDNNTWKISGTLSGYRRPAGGGSYSNFVGSINLTLANSNTRKLCANLLQHFVWSNNSDYQLIINDCNYGF